MENLERNTAITIIVGASIVVLVFLLAIYRLVSAIRNRKKWFYYFQPILVLLVLFIMLYSFLPSIKNYLENNDGGSFSFYKTLRGSRSGLPSDIYDPSKTVRICLNEGTAMNYIYEYTEEETGNHIVYMGTLNNRGEFTGAMSISNPSDETVRKSRSLTNFKLEEDCTCGEHESVELKGRPML